MRYNKKPPRRYWKRTSDIHWQLLDAQGYASAELYKTGFNFWTGLVPPNRENHLPPRNSLYAAMQAAEAFLAHRDEGVV